MKTHITHIAIACSFILMVIGCEQRLPNYRIQKVSAITEYPNAVPVRYYDSTTGDTVIVIEAPKMCNNPCCTGKH